MSRTTLRSRLGFTLVELLVVIGIIALLISILLPSLARARQAATLVSCQASFKQIYNGLLFYAGENRGYLPLCADADRNSYNGLPGINPDIYVALTPLLNGGQPVVGDGPFSQVFTCSERLVNAGTFCWLPNQVTTMKWNPRAFPGEGYYVEVPQRKLSSIKNSTDKIAFWEGAQIIIWNMSTEPSAVHLDNWGISYGHRFTDPPADGDYTRWDATVASGPNADVMNWWLSEIRFRHLGNTTTPVAFFDGHVESRKVGEIKVKDICINK